MRLISLTHFYPLPLKRWKILLELFKFARVFLLEPPNNFWHNLAPSKLTCRKLWSKSVNGELRKVYLLLSTSLNTWKNCQNLEKINEKLYRKTYRLCRAKEGKNSLITLKEEVIWSLGTLIVIYEFISQNLIFDSKFKLFSIYFIILNSV